MTISSFVRQVGAALASPFSTSFNPALELSEHELVRDTQPRVSGNLLYCQHLTAAASLDHATLANAWRAIEVNMALVPAGEVRLSPVVPTEDQAMSQDRTVHVSALYIDRYAVSNQDFRQFVQDNGYNREDLWPAEILPHMLQFVDQSGKPGPRDWKLGKPPVGKERHPVTGISWFEAHAYACWVGKRLPTSAQWQRAACWFSADAGPKGGRFPWGNVFDPARANTWHRGPGDTVPVDAFANGCTPNGVHQLIGNVWEWLANEFGLADTPGSPQLVCEMPLAEIRGGAFNTYFETQATAHFRSAQRLLHRGPSTGFRCCITLEDLPPPPDPSAFFLETN